MRLEMYPPPGKPSTPPTWEDIERLALHYAVVHRAVWLVRRGELTREEALIHVAFALASAFQELFHAEVERKMMEVPPIVLMERPSSPAGVAEAKLALAAVRVVKAGIAPWEEQAQATIANLAADLSEARSERQREHDRRVLCQSDADTLGTTLAEAQERIKTLVIYGDSASELLGREAGKVVTLRAELADAQRERYVTEKARDDKAEEVVALRGELRERLAEALRLLGNP
jgi:hypothetical protein